MEANNTVDVRMRIIADAEQARKAVDGLKNSMDALGHNSGTQSINKSITSIGTAIEKIQNKMNRGVDSKSDITKLTNELEHAQDASSKLRKSLEEVSQRSDIKQIEFIDPKTANQITKAEKALDRWSNTVEQGYKNVEEYRNALDAAKKAEDEFNKAQEKQTNAQTKADDAAKAVDRYRTAYENLRKAVESYNKSKKKLDDQGDNATSQQRGAVTTARNRVNEAVGVMREVSGKNINSNTIINTDDKMWNLLASGLSTVTSAANTANTELENANTTLENSKGRLDDTNQALAQVQSNIDTKNLQEVNQVLSSLGVDTTNITNLEQARTALEGIKNINLDQAQAQLDALRQKNTDLDEVISQLLAHIKELKGQQQATDRQMGNTESLARRIEMMASVVQMYRIFKNALKDAYNTVKELDAAMTETAVVTTYSVNDMWGTISDYTKRANELGVAISDVYEASTLYYQQGLSTNEVTQLTTSTLKMARIAGLDAAEATDRMTNALRGFNMELNETNSENVADVYSKLASITASNVDEISTAMTKVASLANSANMSFENTAAFLSQIIETTRESAETAGTALKTVVARFAEVKEAPTGSVDVEGEAASYNNIDKALRSVGISLDAFMKGQEGLDSVLMKLAAKWNTLSTATQRYIATQAAGSRQQSRFIALMSDYARMQELTTAANNAAGASAEQYAKTLESLETKLSRLQNAWDAFTTGILDQDIIKDVVDLLTNIVNALNNFNDSVEKSAGSTEAFMLRLLEGITILGTLSMTLRGVAGAVRALGGGEGKSVLKEFGKGATSVFSNLSKVIRKTAAASVEAGGGVKILGIELTETNAIALTTVKILGAMLAKLLLVVAAIYLLVKAYQLYKANSIEGRLESASTQLSYFTDEVNTARDAVNSLSDTFESFTDARLEIGELAKGTAEWNAKVLELNTSIIDLLSEYELLGQEGVMYEISSDGIYSLTETGRTEIQKQANAKLVTTTAIKNEQQRYVNELQKESDINAGYKAVKNEATNPITKTDFTNLVNGLADGSITSSELAQNTAQYGREVVDKAQELADEIINNNIAEQANTEALVQLTNSIDNPDLPEGDAVPVATMVAATQEGYVEDKITTLYKTAAENAEKAGLMAGDKGYDPFIDGQIENEFKEAVTTLYGDTATYRKDENGNYTITDSDGTVHNNVDQAATIRSYYAQEWLGSDEYQNANTKSAEQVTTWRNQIDIDDSKIGTDAAKALEDRIVAAYAEVAAGDPEAMGSLNLSREEYEAIDWTTMPLVATDVNNPNNRNQANIAGNIDAGTEATDVYNVLDDEFEGEFTDKGQAVADAIWESVYKAVLAGGDSDAYAQAFAGQNLGFLQKLLESGTLTQEQAAGINKAINEQKADNKEATQNYTFQSQMTAASEIGEFTGQDSAYEAEAMALAGINDKIELLNVNGEKNKDINQEQAAKTAAYTTQLRQVAAYGDDAANAIDNYNTATEEGNTGDKLQALYDLSQALSSMGYDVNVDTLMDKDVSKYIAGATQSAAGFKKLIESITLKNLEDETSELDQTSRNLLKTMITDGADGEAAMEAINEQLAEGTIEAEDLEKLLGGTFEYLIEVKNGTKQLTALSLSDGAGYKDIISSGNKTTNKSTWENPLEYQYNLLRQIEAEQRKRNKLEKEYNLLVEKSAGSMKELAELIQEQKNEYATERADQVLLATNYQNRLEELNAKANKTKAGGKKTIADYISYNSKENRLTVDWDAWQTLEDKKTSSDATIVKNLEKFLEDFQAAKSGLDEAEDAIADIDQNVANIRKQALSDYTDLLEQTMSMLADQEQKSIDLQQEELDAMQEASDRLYDAISKSVKEIRQLRQNSETETDIANLTRRIAYLKQDTSGANQLTIKELEEQLSDMELEYSDTLVDQHLEDLQEAEDEAFQQRQDMLDNQQSQLDWMIEYGGYSKDATEKIKASVEQMANPQNGVAVDIKDTPLGKLFADSNTSYSPTKLSQDLTDLETKLASISSSILWFANEELKPATQLSLSEAQDSYNNSDLTSFKEQIMAIATSGDEGLTEDGLRDYLWSMLGFTDADLSQTWDNTLNKMVDVKDFGQVIKKGGKTSTQVAGAQAAIEAISSWRSLHNLSYGTNTDNNANTGTSTETSTTKKPSDIETVMGPEARPADGDEDLKIIQQFLKDKGYYSDKIDGKYGTNTTKAVQKLQQELIDAGEDLGSWGANGYWGPLTAAAVKNYFKGVYATGGLADFTGPAWLDGSKSKPELVLNATDTQNFIQLRDILRNLANQNSGESNNGTYLFDVDINVDQVATDYDIDALASRVESNIVSAMSYRSNTLAGKSK